MSLRKKKKRLPSVIMYYHVCKYLIYYVDELKGLCLIKSKAIQKLRFLLSFFSSTFSDKGPNLYLEIFEKLYLTFTFSPNKHLEQNIDQKIYPLTVFFIFHQVSVFPQIYVRADFISKNLWLN